MILTKVLKKERNDEKKRLKQVHNMANGTQAGRRGKLMGTDC